ncbi:MAG: thioredoxin domain-containing protein [Armatimonadota bacterium]
MRSFVIALVVVCLVVLSIPLYAQATTQNSGNEEKAKELYLAGEKSYKEGKLEEAIVTWNKSLDLSPNSEETKNSVAKAKDELYKNTMEFCNDPNQKDLVTAFVNLISIQALIPEKATEFQEKAKAVVGRFDNDQKRATIYYQQSVKKTNEGDYNVAAQYATISKIYAPDSVAVGKLIGKINEIREKKATANPPSQPQPAQSSHVGIGNGKPNLVIFYADWCAAHAKMSPMLKELQDQYKDKVNILFVDVDNQSNKDILKKDPIKGVPLQVLYDKDQKEVFSNLGEITKDQLVAELNKVAG